MAEPNKEQVAITEELQMLLLQDFLKMFRDGTMGASDRKTLKDLLVQNGWNLDPSMIPQGLVDKLTRKMDPKELDKNDPDVIGRIAS